MPPGSPGCPRLPLEIAEELDQVEVEKGENRYA